MSCSAGAAELASEHFVIKSERRDKKCDRGERERGESEKSSRFPPPCILRENQIAKDPIDLRLNLYNFKYLHFCLQVACSDCSETIKLI